MTIVAVGISEVTVALSRLSTLLVATTVALSPVAFTAAAEAHGAPARSHHHHHGGHHSTTAAKRHKLHHELTVDLAKVAALRHQIKHSQVSAHDRAVLLHKLNGLSHRLSVAGHHLHGAGFAHHWRKVSKEVDADSQVLAADRRALGGLHSLERLAEVMQRTNKRLDQDEARCEEEDSEQMYDVDLAITDLDSAQSAIQDARRILLSGSSGGARGHQHAGRTVAHDRHRAAKNLRAAAAALADLEGTFS